MSGTAAAATPTFNQLARHTPVAGLDTLSATLLDAATPRYLCATRLDTTLHYATRRSTPLQSTFGRHSTPLDEDFLESLDSLFLRHQDQRAASHLHVSSRSLSQPAASAHLDHAETSTDDDDDHQSDGRGCRRHTPRRR